MGDEEIKGKNYVKRAVGKDMNDLILKIEEKFKEEYGFSPSIIHITNLIAMRVKEANLF